MGGWLSGPLREDACIRKITHSIQRTASDNKRSHTGPRDFLNKCGTPLNAWFGHSQAVAERHYEKVTEDDYAEVTNQVPSDVGQTVGQSGGTLEASVRITDAEKPIKKPPLVLNEGSRSGMEYSGSNGFPNDIQPIPASANWSQNRHSPTITSAEIKPSESPPSSQILNPKARSTFLTSRHISFLSRTAHVMNFSSALPNPLSHIVRSKCRR